MSNRVGAQEVLPVWAKVSLLGHFLGHLSITRVLFGFNELHNRDLKICILQLGNFIRKLQASLQGLWGSIEQKVVNFFVQIFRG